MFDGERRAGGTTGSAPAAEHAESVFAEVGSADGLRPATAARARWQAATQVIEFAANTGVLLVLAHETSPSAFGMVAFASAAVLMLVGVLVTPVSSAVIAKQLAAGRPADTAFWLAVGPTLALAVATAAVCALAGVRGTELAVICGVGLALPVIAGQQVLMARLQQVLAFRRLSAARIAGSVTGSAIALLIAVAWDQPLWGLIARTTGVPLLQAVGMLALVRPRPRPQADRATVRTILGYGRGMVGFNVVNQVLRKGDDVLVGVLVSTHALGLYSVAYRFIEVPVGQVSQLASGLIFPTLMKVDDEARMRRVFLRSQRVLVWAVAPFATASAALGDVAVPALLGPAWDGAGPVVQVFGAITLLQLAGTQSGTLFLYGANTGAMFRWSVTAAPVILLGFLIGAHWGALGVAYGYLVANMILFYPLWHFAGRLVGMPARDVLRSLAPLLAAAVVVALALAGARQVVAIDDLVDVALAALCGAVAFWGVTAAGDASLRGDVRALLHR